MYEGVSGSLDHLETFSAFLQFLPPDPHQGILSEILGTYDLEMTVSWQTVSLFWNLKSLPESRQSPFRSLVATQSHVCLLWGSALSSQQADAVARNGPASPDSK